MMLCILACDMLGGVVAHSSLRIGETKLVKLVICYYQKLSVFLPIAK